LRAASTSAPIHTLAAPPLPKSQRPAMQNRMQALRDFADKVKVQVKGEH
jgi:hypothetical protein